MHAVLSHLEQVLPGQFAQFVLLDGSVQVALLAWLVPVGFGQHLPAALVLAGGVDPAASGRVHAVLNHHRGVHWNVLEVRIVGVRYSLKGSLVLHHLCKRRFDLRSLHIDLGLQFLAEVLVKFDADSSPIALLLLLPNNRSVLAGYQLPKHVFLDAHPMHDHLEDLDELLLVDEILVEAKLLDGPQDLQLLIDL